MSDTEDGAATLPARRFRRRVVLLGLLFALLAFGGWLAVELIHGKAGLEQARDSVLKAKDALASGNPADAAKWANEARLGAQNATDASHSLPWEVASAIPWAGSPLKTGRQISDVVLGLVSDVIQPSIDIGGVISPDGLRDESESVDVQGLRAAAPKLVDISSAATRLAALAGAISNPEYSSSVRAARAALQSQTADVSRLLARAALAARLAPSLMGVDGPRTYFVGFQTNAEARGTGGLLGGFGILRFDDGRPSVEQLGSNAELKQPLHPIDLGPEYMAQYGSVNPTKDFRNSNLSSHFPYAAQIWKSMWEQQSGTHVDGVISIDPVATSYLLGATGPITMPDGEIVTKDNVVTLTESTAYTRFADDNAARKRYLQEIAGEVVAKMTADVPSPRALLDALGKAAGEGRIAVWSESAEDERLLEETPLAQEIPDDPAPYAGVVINNIGGNKLDYYLTRQIEYSAGACDSDTRKSTVTVRLTNNVPDAPLPDYVAGSGGLVGGPVQVLPPPGTNTALVTLLATTNAKLTGAFVDGQKVQAFGLVERGHPVFEFVLGMMRGEIVDIRFELEEPTSAGAARVPIQPLLDTVAPVVSVPECGG